MARTSFGPAPSLPTAGLSRFPPIPFDHHRDWEALFRLLSSTRGLEFSGYLRTFVSRRVARRRLLLGIETLRQYVSLLRRDPGERAALCDDLLLTVTSFFRDPGAFRALASRVLPVLLRNREPGSPLRIWVAGCSTGEEGYSVAMSVIECQDELGAEVPCQVFSTDIREDVIRKARAALYPATIAESVSKERLARFFTPCPGGFRGKPQVRALCVFARHDLTRDPPFPRMDLVCCRNVLIFMDTPLRDQVLQSLFTAVRPGGFLFLGAYESPGPLRPLLAVVDSKWKLFARPASP